MNNSFLNMRCAAVLLALACWQPAQAALFEDDEARRAILDLRQQLTDQVQPLQRNLLDQQNQIEALRADLANLRGEKEALEQELKRQQGAMQALDERLRKFEPASVKVDGVEFLADRGETRAYESALAVFRSGDFKGAAGAFTDFLKRYPQTGYAVSTYFWLGNAQYANRDYKEAIKNFSALLSKAPDHQRAPDALLSIANCQIDGKDIKAAQKTLADVVAKYPQTEAAQAAKERLAKLK